MLEQNLNQVLIAVATAILALVTMAFVAISIVLNYHWNRYCINKKSIKRVKRIYVGVSAVLFAFMVATYVLVL